MSNLSEIEKEILQLKSIAQNKVRHKYLKALHEYTQRDTILYASAYAAGVGRSMPPLVLSIMTDDIQGFMASIYGLKGDKLDLILHSPGGSLEAAEQIVNYLRAKYKHIRAIIPQNAMSAATMIACACDEIFMGKQSAIGPIDPQVTFLTQHGPYTSPAQALLDEFDRAKAEVTFNPALAPLWVSKMRDYPPGIFNVCSRTLALAVEKVSGWLTSYMFAGEADGETRARAVATWLGTANIHKTHDRPINLEEAIAHGLKVEPLENDQTLQDRVLSVFHAVVVTFKVSPLAKIIENHDGRGCYLQVEPRNLG